MRNGKDRMVLVMARQVNGVMDSILVANDMVEELEEKWWSLIDSIPGGLNTERGKRLGLEVDRLVDASRYLSKAFGAVMDVMEELELSERR